MQTIAIKVKQLSYRYKGNSTDSLKQVSFQIPVGACTALIGPNGAGKSTLISLLSGLMQPQTGSIEYTQSTTKLSHAIKSEVALVPQEYAFYPQMSILQNLTYFAALLKLPAQIQTKRIDKVLLDTGLQQRINQKAAHLSGGYKRRLNLAIALLKAPQILFLDEPTVGIDPISRDEIIKLIKKLKSEGKTIIYTSHLLTEVEDICDDILLLQQGEMSHFNPAQQAKKLAIKLTQPIVQYLSSEQIQRFNIKQRDNEIICQPNNQADLKQLLITLIQTDCEIESIIYQAQSLNQQYIHLFGQHDSTEY